MVIRWSSRPLIEVPTRGIGSVMRVLLREDKLVEASEDFYQSSLDSTSLRRKLKEDSKILAKTALSSARAPAAVVVEHLFAVADNDRAAQG